MTYPDIDARYAPSIAAPLEKHTPPLVVDVLDVDTEKNLRPVALDAIVTCAKMMYFPAESVSDRNIVSVPLGTFEVFAVPLLYAVPVAG